MGTALVLGGGGITGIAWEIGIVAGLEESGTVLRDADVIIGTSAGSVVGAQLRSGVPTGELYEKELRPRDSEIPARMGLGALLRFVALGLTAPDDVTAARRVARESAKTRTVDPAERLRVIGARLPETAWPERDLRITAVDAETGELAVFDRSGPATLTEAVNASCAVPFVWPAATVAGRRYVDGGVRSGTNIDLAAGYERVIVLAPTTRAVRRSGLATTQLRALGPDTEAVLITPDAAARKAFGPNALDPTRAPAAARAGRAQADTVRAKVHAVLGAS
ncbi:patatin-like phospholipase family protein [Nocardia thailandica]|uniref:patatin-like phospholipase family protein n=1 Tax=Nocardia thailandica TaxID=257275 RepID=UPI00031C7C05|nr:patatin-like phospholipase family protein [Nocardia thailandica]